MAKRQLLLEEVEALPLNSYDWGSSDWTLTNGLFRRAGLLPNIVLEVETICKQTVIRKLGVGFLPHIAVCEEFRREKLMALEIMDAETLRCSLDAILPRRHRAARSNYWSGFGRRREPFRKARLGSTR
jgi:DNA-binding transcriptional LysR family regulator